MPTFQEMAARGWGYPGYPNSPEFSTYVQNHIKVIEVAGLRMMVRIETAPLFHALILLMERHGVDLSKQHDDWSLCNKGIEGYSAEHRSLHSWGLAIDLDAMKNPYGATKTSFPVMDTRKAAEDCSLDWGYLWNGTKDPMHFQYVGNRTSVDAAKARLKNRHPLLYRTVTHKPR